MPEELHHYRKSYEKGMLSEENLERDPMQQFRIWFFEAQNAEGIEEVNAMTLSTIGLDGFPKGRIVLLKRFDENGFYFYTNYESEKGRSIAENNHISLSFFWPNLERQVLIKGVATKTTEEDSNHYFQSRPRGSQLGAVVSNQSGTVENRAVLEEKLRALEIEFENMEIPKPAHWGGFLVKPIAIEFWQGRANRLHDRILYSLVERAWKIERLAP